MVTDDERDYMYSEYAHDPRMRVNVGIRRRLAPLLDNSRRRQELLHSLLFSMPGTPILYYGDEIGMGDNIYLGDRNGVRTPMQWNGDRNAGFSRADPQALYLPLVIDPVYHYQSVNVEAQRRVPSSLLNWMRRLIAIRKRYPVFGRGTIEFLHPANLAVLAYLRLRRRPDHPGGQQPVALRPARRAGPERVHRLSPRRAVRRNGLPQNRRRAVLPQSGAAHVLLVQTGKQQRIFNPVIAPGRRRESSGWSVPGMRRSRA